jgi:hypothetical protein
MRYLEEHPREPRITEIDAVRADRPTFAGGAAKQGA